MRYILLAVALLTGSSAQAAPALYYNPANGDLRLENDGKHHWVYPGGERDLTITGTTIFNIKSPQGRLRNPSNIPPGLNPSPGLSLLDTGDLPTFLVAFAKPGTYIFANAVEPGTPARELEAEWYFYMEPPPTSIPVIEVPEPTAGVAFGSAILILVALCRRR